MTSKRGTPEGDCLDVLVTLVEAWVNALQLALEAEPGVSLTKGAATQQRIPRPAIVPKEGRSKKGRGK